MSVKDISNTLVVRGRHYGGFEGNARIAQNIKSAMRDSPNWEEMDCDMKEAMELIASKIGRLLNGNVNHFDGWHDIEGYARLVSSRLKSP